jgi:pSer/pThr/pTyr-binding forkhead associated (FHA) protein
MAKLIVESGGSRREQPLSNPCRIGRDDENDIVLNDPGSSRRHCRIAKDGEAWILEDLHSANGTFRNEERIDRVRLADGDIVRIGASKLTFRAADVAVESDEIQLEDPGAAPSGGAQWRLIGVTGEVKGRRFDLAGSRLTFGRKSSNAIPLGDNKVSGVHCEVVIESGRPVLRDLGSTNGTYLEGKRIDEIALSHGDRFGLGECVFVVADRSEPEPELERRDAESERTMIQEPGFQRDAADDDEMEAVSRANLDAVKRGSSIVGTLVMLLLVGGIAGAGWFWIDQKNRAKAAAEVPPAPGNLLVDRWSFEATESLPAPATAWDLAIDGPEGDARESFSLASGAGKSGDLALRAAFESGAVAALRDAIPAVGRRYTISGFARTEGEATASLVARFTSNDDPTYALRAVIGSVQGGAYSPLGGPVVSPSGE